MMLLKEEKDFYERYQWVLQPFLTCDQIMKNLTSLMGEDLNSKPEWYRREWNINLYMLSSAVADLVDDYLVRGILNYSKLADYISFLGKPVKALRDISIFNTRIRNTLRDRDLRQWRRLWSEWLIKVCYPLVADQGPDLNEQKRLSDELIPLIRLYTHPKNLLSQRTRIPAAYRSQDLTHHDFISLSKKYCTRYPDHRVPHVVIGLRTAGSYIAPVICAYLRKAGYNQTSYMTIRPKSFIHPWDEAQLKQYAKLGARFILVDEPPDTGKTIARCIDILKKFAIDTRQVALMVPLHPANRNWVEDSSVGSSFRGTEIISLKPEEWYKAGLLTSKKFYESLKPYFTTLGFHDIEVEETTHTKQINDELVKNPDRAFHVRMKKVFQVVPKDETGVHNSLIIMGKSVGWGWLGYHAALAACSLSGFTPRVFGVRNGMMYLEWVKNEEKSKTVQDNRIRIVDVLSAYISRRANELRLQENPTNFLSNYRDSGLQSISIILSKAFGPKVSKLKRGWARKQLGNLACPVPTLIDARMTRKEWIDSEAGLFKVDFEHHGFNKTASYNIADPAYDMATAMIEFGLSDQEKDKLIHAYIHATGDTSVNDRLVYYKLLAGSHTMGESLRKLNTVTYSNMYSQLNTDYVRSWNFLVSETMRHTAAFCEGSPVENWKAPLFVMDVDDVLDKNILGFPSTTANGVRAISLLRSHGICTVINTARSLGEVRDYCKHYKFVGGIAEYGSAIWDELRQQVEVTVPPEALKELSLLRDALTKIPGIFVNHLYQYSLRAYTFDGQRTVPLPDVTVGVLFHELGIKHLTAKKSFIDTAIFASSVDKGKTLLRMKELKGLDNCMTAAIGDTESDFPMLIKADQGYLVANSSMALKRKVRHFGVISLKASYQAGLLEAVIHFLHGRNGKPCHTCRNVIKAFDQKSDLFWRVLDIGDMSDIRHWFSAFDRNTVEAFRD